MSKLLLGGLLLAALFAYVTAQHASGPYMVAPAGAPECLCTKINCASNPSNECKYKVRREPPPPAPGLKPGIDHIISVKEKEHAKWKEELEKWEFTKLERELTLGFKRAKQLEEQEATEKGPLCCIDIDGVYANVWHGEFCTWTKALESRCGTEED
eukprot:GILK01000789.1.p1 GENE.GILK01000789.1~~GILK01000789.1.p1  ORF type:complete len:172 (-),score=23.36 GILK01000789.1:196-663(-)